MLGPDGALPSVLPSKKPSYWDQCIGWCIPILTMMGGLMMPLFGIHFKHFDVGLAFLNTYPVIASYLTVLSVLALVVEINGIHAARKEKGWKSGKFWDRLGVFLFKGLPLAIGSGVFLYVLRFLPKDANGLVSFAIPAQSTLGILLLTAQVLLIVAFAFDTLYCAYKAVWYHGKSSAANDPFQPELYRAKIGKYVSRGLNSGTTLGALVLIFFFNTIPPFTAVITTLAITCGILAFVAWRCERRVQQVEKNHARARAMTATFAADNNSPQNGVQPDATADSTANTVGAALGSAVDATEETKIDDTTSGALQRADSTTSVKSEYGTPPGSTVNLTEVGTPDDGTADGEQTKQQPDGPNLTPPT